MRFEDYLAEAFGTREVPFGMNETADDGKFESKWDHVFTDTIYNGERFRVGYDTDSGSVMFSNRTDGSSKIKPMRQAKTSLDVYNRIAFVVMKLLDHTKATHFRFESEHDDLKQLYGKFVANKSFQRMIRERGWQYEGEKYEGLFTFKKLSK